MATRNSLFSTYRQGENRVTSSMIAVFERLDVGLVERLLGAAGGGSALKLITFRNQVGGVTDTVPDAEISAKFRFLFEVKTQRGQVRQEQLLGHLEALTDSHANERLFVVTPDDSKPNAVPDDVRVIWFNFLTLSQAIDRLLDDNNELVFEHTHFLLRELQALFAVDGLLGIQEDTVVVPARWAYPMYLDSEAYVCQQGRTFPPHIKRVAFYADGEIKPQVALITHRQDNVSFTFDESRRLAASNDEVGMHLSNVIAGRLGKHEIAEGDQQQVFLLSSPADNARTLWLSHPICNNKVDYNGKTTAWVMNQRYVRATVLQAVAAQNGKTSDIDDARFSK
jgi:hypothetical protein